MREQKREVGEGGSGRSRSGVDLQTFGVYWGGREGITSKQTKKKERKKATEKKLSIHNYYVINECMLSHCDKTFCFCM